MKHYHPGTCEATVWGKRYGKNLTPQRWDDPKHQWHLANNKNWGPWSCCGGIASSPGCQSRVDPVVVTLSSGGDGIAMLETGKRHIRFLNDGNICQVIADEGRCWRLDNGRVAKKKTEGTAWAWTEGPLLMIHPRNTL